MRYKLLGKSGLRVSELCLGTMTFGDDWGWGSSKDESRAVYDAFVESGVVKSKGEGRRLVDQGGAYVNNRRRSGIDTNLTSADLASESIMVLRSGKKKYALLQFE